MKFLAVRLYRDELNPQGIPGDWPSQSLEVELENADDPLPEPYNVSPWIKMDEDQLAQQKADNQDAYDAWFTAKRDFYNVSSSRRSGIKGRMEWGQQIVLDFRDYAVAKNINPADSIALMTALSGVLPYLQLGLLAPAAYLLGNIGANSFLDGTFDATVFDVTVVGGTTVKQYFIAKILEGAV